MITWLKSLFKKRSDHKPQFSYRFNLAHFPYDGGYQMEIDGGAWVYYEREGGFRVCFPEEVNCTKWFNTNRCRDRSCRMTAYANFENKVEIVVETSVMEHLTNEHYLGIL